MRRRHSSADLLSTAMRARRHREIMAAFGSEALRGHDLDALLTQACARAAEGLEVERAKVLEYRAETDDLLIRTGVGWSEDVVGRACLPANLASPPGLAFRTGEAVYIEDHRQAPDFEYSDLLLRHGVVALVNVPIRLEDFTFGVLEADSTEPRRFTEDDRNFLLGFANLLAAAVQRQRAETERERLLHELRQADAELRRLNESLERRVAERARELRERDQALLEARKLEALGRSTGMIAHDFNNIMTAAIGNLTLLERRVKTDPRLLKLAAEARHAVERGERMAQQLLAFAGKQRLEPRPVDVNAAVRGIEDLLVRTLGREIRLRKALAPDLRPALADLDQLERALLNLVTNARDAMRPQAGGVLSIETENVQLAPGEIASADELAPGPYVRLTVRDTGTGMPPEVREHAFEPFFTTKPAGAGTGLGLSMVYGFAHQSKGWLTIDSAEGKGTAVNVYLPQASEGTAP
jgi:signal transduction histidine kinase